MSVEEQFMKIIVTGATGLVGSALVPKLLAEGHVITRLVRQSTQNATASNNVTDVLWDPDKGTIEAGALERHDAAVHLAGENVAERWTDEKKRRIRDSRVKGTQLIAETLARLERKPKALISASAIGFYGSHRGAEALTEESVPVKDFLSEVCREWEGATEPARRGGIRVVNLRIGIVLSDEGGALAKMLTPFKMGVGGKVGSGEQYMSWVALDDVVTIIQHALKDEKLSGPVNAVAPRPVTNNEFTETLGKVLGRPTIFPMPSFAVKLLFGEMGETLLLSSERVEPARLQSTTDFKFTYPELEGALRHALGK